MYNKVKEKSNIRSERSNMKSGSTKNVGAKLSWFGNNGRRVLQNECTQRIVLNINQR